jgi:O-antigen/teichoic acid export membrane protein
MKEFLGLLAAAAVAILPIGFLISAISVTLLALLAKVCRKPTYEAVLSESTFDRIWATIGSVQTKDSKLTLYLTATFDHELLPSGIHKWLMRRWNHFNVASHSIVALALAHAVAPAFSIPQSWAWFGTTTTSMGLFSWTGYAAWRQTMRMIDFQSYRFNSHVSTDEGDRDAARDRTW